MDSTGMDSTGPTWPEDDALPDGVASGHCESKNLCLDVVDADVSVTFWSAALGLTVAPERNSMALVGETDAELVVDSTDASRIPRWWVDRLQASVHRDAEQGFCWLEPAAGTPWEMVFAHVGEPKATKNRVHGDVYGRHGRPAG